MMSSAKSFEVPSYIEDPQNIEDNICIIINANAPDTTSGSSVVSGNRKINETIGEYAARLYADAISIRANMVNNASSGNMATEAVSELGGMIGGKAGKAVQEGISALSSILASKDKAAVLQNDVKRSIKNIAIYLKQIVELEAGIANLEGLQVITSLGDVKCEGNEEDD